MPTVECEHTDCEHHGYDICIAKRVRWEENHCLDYISRIGKQMLDQPFNPRCYKSGGKYKSNRVTGVLR